MEELRPAEGPQAIEAYGAGSFTIASRRHQGSILVLADRALAWAPTSTAEITLESLEPIRDAVPAAELLLLGTGAKFELISPVLRQAVRAWGPIVEPMATPAACRTYNLLLSEGRRVAAALIALPG
jgi:uncharacterized protein